MIKLNLVYPEKSQVKFSISRFPDGQQSIDIESSRLLVKNNEIQILSRLNNFRDLELVIAANQALLNMGAENIHLYTPYFIGARSDRKFREGGVNYLKQVICPIINSQNFKSVTVLDPHSDVLEACLNNFEKTHNYEVVKKALESIDNKNGAQDRIILVSPDGGALKKIYDVASEFKIPKIITASKVRDIRTGKIVNTDVPSLKGNFCMEPDQKFVVIDDICDGGRTFIELSKAITLQRPDAEIHLIVTHGIFSGGFKSLSENLSGIYTTNSFRDIPEDELSGIDKFVVQMDVFQ